MPPPVSIPAQFGIKYPHPDELRTGDLLFPRKPRSELEAFFDAKALWSLSQREQTVRDLLGPDLVELVEKDTPGLDLGQIYARPRRLQVLEAASDANNVARLFLLVKILRVEFRDIAINWFNLTVEQLLINPLVKVLLKALDGDIINNDSGFFVGHCAVVLREQDGTHTDDVGDNSNLYVIEANVSDFDHYRVAIHPYYVPNDGDNGRYRGWLNFRASQDNLVWHSRHTDLDDPSAAAPLPREQLLQAAKAYLGTSYSFFDNSAFGHPGRLYCSEFIYRAFDDVRLGQPVPPVRANLRKLDDTRWWQWMRVNNPPQRHGDLGEAVETAMEDPVIGPYVRDREFFILTVQMLWRSRTLEHLLQPYGEAYA